MISPQQKMLPHIYAQAAALREHEYRALLRAKAGVASCADPEITQSGWEHLMAALEALLFDRVREGRVPDPRGRNRYITREHYWRGRLPRHGRINSRQCRIIEDLWRQLSDKLPEEQKNRAYFTGLVRRATGNPNVGAQTLSSHEAGLVIDALKDRITYQIRKERAAI